MQLKQFPIALANRTFARHEQIRKVRGYKPGSLLTEVWALALKGAHDKGEFAVCMCLEPEQDKRRLAVKKSPAGLYHLARFPGTEREHSPYCLYSKADGKRPGAQGQDGGVLHPAETAAQPELADPFSPQAMQQLGAVEEKNIQYMLQERDTKPDAKRKPRAIAFSEILPSLWKHAGLTAHDGTEGYRVKAVIQLGRACDKLEINELGLSSCMLLYTTDAYEKHSRRNQQIVEACITRGTEIWMISFLSRFCAEKHAKVNLLPISGFHGMPFFYLEPQSWAETLQNYPVAASAWHHGYPVAVLIKAELHGGKSKNPRVQGKVLDAALMAVTEGMVPVFSGAEYALANRLCEESRTFIKPLPICASSGRYAPYTANFILTDTGERNTPIVLIDPGAPTDTTRERLAYFSNLYPQPDAWWKWSMGGSLNAPLPAPKSENVL